MLNTNNLLFIDTEHNIKTYEPECIQTLFRGKVTIFETFDKQSEKVITDMWNTADAVVMWNAPFDLGKLSSMFDNSYKWVVTKRGSYGKSAIWKLQVFGNIYQVRKIGAHRNLINPLNRMKKTKSTPVVDLLKLWSILIEEEDISLKHVLKRYQYSKEVIEFTPEASETKAYREQDVLGLEFLTKIFLEKVKDILDLGTFSWEDWGFIKTAATFTKRSYNKRYPMPLFKSQYKSKLEYDSVLRYALEKAYKGGITLSFHRGTVENTGWVDIKSAYANTIKHYNTDKWLTFDTVRYEGDNWDYKKFNCLVLVRQNFCIESVRGSLKLFVVKEPTKRWVWYNDIVASKNFYPGYKYTVLEGYEFIPTNNVEKSLVEEWVAAKEEPGLKDRNITLYKYYKFLSNTSYGIKAQRKPFETNHTNMVIAGMITANVHRILATINKTISDMGYTPKYNDTDSCCFAQNKVFTEDEMFSLVSTINKNIEPFEVESEGFNKTTHFLSLKRYTSIGGTDKDKIKLHGKGRYNIYKDDTLGYMNNKTIPNKKLMISNLAGNTEITLKMVLKLRPQFKMYAHPFMFIKDVECERDIKEFFESWYEHTDTKTTFPEGDFDCDIEFSRDFHVFDDIIDAMEFFGVYTDTEEDDKDSLKADDVNDSYRNWDDEIKEDFTID